MKFLHTIDYYWIINFWRGEMLICGDTSTSSSIIFPAPCQSTRSIKNHYGFSSYGIHLTECSAFTLCLFNQDSHVFLIYIARFLCCTPCCSDSVCRDLKAALLFLSYSLRLANLNKLQVLIQFWWAYMIPRDRISFFRR